MKRLILAALLVVGVSGEVVASDDEAVLLHCFGEATIEKNIRIAKDGSWLDTGLFPNRDARFKSAAGIWYYKSEDVNGNPIEYRFSAETMKLVLTVGDSWTFSHCFPIQNPFTN